MKIILFLTLLSTVHAPRSANAGTVVCGRLKASAKTLYPVNKEAIEIAIKTGLKTCNRSKRYKDAAVAAKHATTFRLATQEEIDKAREAIESGSASLGKAKGKF